ncbi:MAG: efflux RND transporter periplasmic adaptor subunit [Candidatus Limnocylindrales bacterium]
MSRRVRRSRARWDGRPGQATSTIPLEAEPDEIDTDDLETDGIEAEVIDQDEIDEDETEADEAEPEEVDHRRARGPVRMQRADAASPSRSRSRRSRRSILEDEPPEPRRRRVPWLRMLGAGMLVIGLAALTLGVVRPWIASSVTTTYTTGPVTFGDVIATSVATGTVEASTVYGLKFGSSPDIVSSTTTTSGSGGAVASGWTGNQAQSLNWPVKTVVVTQGQKVKQGDVLATADSSDAQVALLSAQANLGVAQSRLTDDQADSKTRSSTILQDQAQVASAQASYDHAKAAASQDQLVAPADGLVIAVNILPGVNAPSGYAIEVESGSLVAVASFTESDVNKLEPGQPATISVTAVGTSVPGVVASIAPAPTSATDGSSSSVGGGSQSSVVAYAVRVTLTSPPETVRAGMTATVTITTGSATDVMRVPATAVSGSASTGYTVRVLKSDGSVSSVAVGIGLVTSSYVEITYGLSSSETVVTGTSATRNGTTTTGGGFQLPGLGGGFVGR